MTGHPWARCLFVLILASLLSALASPAWAMTGKDDPAGPIIASTGPRTTQPYVLYTIFVHTLTAGTMGDAASDPLPELYYKLLIDDVLISNSRDNAIDDNASVTVDTSYKMNGTKDQIKLELQLWDKDGGADDQIDISPSHGSGAPDVTTPIRGATFIGQFDLYKRTWASASGDDVPVFNGESYELDGSKDNDGDTVNEGKVTIQLKDIDHPPELVRSAVYIDMVEDGRSTTLVSDVFRDKDGTQFIFSWDQDIPASFSYDQDRLIIAPLPNYHGVFSFEVDAIQGATVLTAAFHVNVTSVEDRPQPDIDVAIDSAMPFTETPLSALGSRDGDGDPLTFKWDFDLTNGVQVDAVGPIAFPIYTRPGVYGVTLTASDGKADVSTDAIIPVGTLDIGSIKTWKAVPGSFEVEMTRADTLVQTVTVLGEDRSIVADNANEYFLTFGMRFDMEVSRNGKVVISGDMTHRTETATTAATIEALDGTVTYSLRARPSLTLDLEKVGRKEKRVLSNWHVETPLPTGFDEDGDGSSMGGTYLWDGYAALRSPEPCTDCLGKEQKALSKQSKTAGFDLRALVDAKGTFEGGPEEQFLALVNDLYMDTDIGMDFAFVDDVLVELVTNGIFTHYNSSVPYIGRLSSGPMKVNATVTGPEQDNLTVTLYPFIQDRVMAAINGKVSVRFNLSLDGGAIQGGSADFLSTRDDAVPTGRAARLDPHDAASVFTSIINRPPEIALKVSAHDVIMGEKVLIDLEGSSDPEHGALLFYIEYGDGNVHDWGAETKLSYIYAKPGSYPMTVTAKDNAGITTTVTEVIRVHPNADWDSRAPIVGINRPVNHSRQLQTTLFMEWTGADDSGIIFYNVSLDDGGWLPTGTRTNHTFIGLKDGPHTVSVRATDTTGNIGSDSVDVYIGKGFDDFIPPQVQITAPKDRERVRTSTVKIEWKTLDDGAGMSHVFVSVDGKQPIRLAVSDTVTLYAMTEGEHVVEVTAFDRVGNNASTSVRFQVDTSQKPTGFAAFLASMDPLTIALIAVIIMLTIGLALFYRQKGIDEERARIERVRARREKDKRELEAAKARAKAEQARKERKRKKGLAGIDIPEEEFEGELPVTKKGTIEPDPGEAAIPVFRSEAEKEKARQATELSLEAELEARRLRKKGLKDASDGEKAAASGKRGGTGAEPVNRLRR